MSRLTLSITFWHTRKLHRWGDSNSTIFRTRTYAGYETLHDVWGLHHDASMSRDHNVDYSQQTNIHNEAAGEKLFFPYFLFIYTHLFLCTKKIKLFFFFFLFFHFILLIHYFYYFILGFWLFLTLERGGSHEG